MIKIREISSFREIKPFINFPYQHYKKCPYWIPPIRQDEMNQFDPVHNPSLEDSEFKLWVAEKEGKVVGRVVGIINERETRVKGEVHGRFGWLEFEEDLSIPNALLERVGDWARERGAVQLKGPVGFTNLDPSGMTVEGFDELGTMHGAYHYPYYGKYMDQLGFEKVVDWLELVLDKAPTRVPDKMKRLLPLLEKKFGLRNFQIKKTHLREKIRESFFLVTDSYKDLPSYVPFSDRQIDHYIDQFLPFIQPNYISLVGDAEGHLLGFGLVVPSFSEPLIKAKGRLFPFGIIPLLWTKRFHRIADLVLIGVVDEWRNKGLNAFIFSKSILAVSAQGVRKIRINPILEENLASLSLFKNLDPRVFRRRRLFAKDLY